MHTGVHEKLGQASPSQEERRQEPFMRVAPLLKSALLMGAGGGFLLASVLTLTRAFAIPLGAWWEAMAQAHGHLQLFGWAGLFVLGVAFHFLPRLRGTPLAGASLVHWLVFALIASLVLRAISQPLLAMYPAYVWRVGLVSSGLLEMVAVACVLYIVILTARRGPRLTTRPAFWSVFPLFVGAFCSLGIASIVNLVNTAQAAYGSGLMLYTGDTLNVTLGLFGFLVPMALAMSARSLPMYAGLDGFPRRVLWPMAGAYFAGLALLCVSIDGGPLPATWASIINGLGMVVTGGVVLLFVGIFLFLIRRRGRLPQRVAKLAPEPETLAQTYQKQVEKEQANYGPFVGLVASAYMWAMFGGLLLLVDGTSLLATGNMPILFDAIRHSFAIGFIALLICGIAPRMLPNFSGRQIVSPRLVSATLWLGNAAAALRVGSILLAPLFPGTQGYAFDTILFSLSGPFGLALAICLAINLWPVLHSVPNPGDTAIPVIPL
jgi:uncharacterized protein involved in response to NO